jgi:hypothetical protein
MNAGWSRALPTLLLASLGAVLLLSLYGHASSLAPAGAKVMRYSSGIYDMDVGRVVADFTTRLAAYRPVVHPLQKLLVAPLGNLVNTRVFEGRDRLGAARVLIAACMTLNALLVGLLAYQLARRSPVAGVVAGLVCGLSFSSLLAASIPESAAVSCLGTVVPLVFLNARIGRPFTWWEGGAWGILGVFCIGFTITQIVHWAIALVVRLGLLRRASGGPDDGGADARLMPKVAVAIAVAAVLTLSGARLQSTLYPGTAPFYSESPLDSERHYLRVQALTETPLQHTSRLLGHFLLYPFLAPLPAYSDYLMRDFGLGYWSLSVEESRPEHWLPAARTLSAAFLLGLLLACAFYGRVGVLFLAPSLSVASQFGLHLFYGREYILYSPNWHGALVAVVFAAAWNGLGRRRTAFLVAVALLGSAMVLNNLDVMRAVYREVDVGLEVELRDAEGKLLKP